MTQFKEQLREVADGLKRRRDELRIQMHLAKAEVRGEWKDLEAQWEHLRSRVDRALDQAEDISDETFETIRQLGKDLEAGYARLQRHLLPRMRDEARTLVETLTQQRDELRVKVHLARAEAKDEWAKAEKRWDQLSAKADMLAREAADLSGDALTAIKLVGDEIADAYKRIREKL